LFQTTLYIAAGGALGTTLRYWIAVWLMLLNRDLPWSTILINIVGSFLISLFAALTAAQARYLLPELWLEAFVVGVCGGFMTFSSFSLQTVDLLRAGAPMRALVNVGLTVTLCIAAAAVGYVVAASINRSVAYDAKFLIQQRAE